MTCALSPVRRSRVVRDKAIRFNDWHFTAGPDGESGLALARWIADHSEHRADMSEDALQSEGRVMVQDGLVTRKWERSNRAAHEFFNGRLTRMLRRAPATRSKAIERRPPSHPCGTLHMGTAPATSGTGEVRRAHDLDNNVVVAARIRPTSAAVDPSLTIATGVFRADAHIRERHFT